MHNRRRRGFLRSGRTASIPRGVCPTQMICILIYFSNRITSVPILEGDTYRSFLFVNCFLVRMHCRWINDIVNHHSELWTDDDSLPCPMTVTYFLCRVLSQKLCKICKRVQKCTKLLEVILKKKKNKSGQIWTNLDKAGEEVGSNVFGRGFSPPPLRELLGVWNKRADKYAANNNGRATTSSCSSWSKRREETKEFCPEERKMQRLDVQRRVDVIWMQRGVMQSPHKVDLVVDNFQQLTASGN